MTPRSCPFCGSSGASVLSVMVDTTRPRRYAVRCKSCGATGPLGDSGKEALSKWGIE